MDPTKLYFSDLIYMLKAVGVTIALSAFAIVAGGLLGAVIGLLRTFRRVKLIRWIIVLYVDTLRGTPLLLQVFLIHYGLPTIGFRTSTLFSALVSLTIFTSAYVAEIVKSGIESINKGQWLAASSLGLNYRQTMWKIILPQAIRIMIPPFTGVCLQMVKDSSLVSLIGFIELARAANIIVDRTYKPLQVYLIAAVFYFIVCYLISTFAKKIERKCMRSDLVAQS